MAELYPAPLENLLLRAHAELAAQGTLFDLPRAKFWTGDPAVDLSVNFHGARAATPLGPAAGPQSQLAANIALSWLGGSRIMELKTVQINDRLKIPRPCIWAGNVGYNVEWSQELLVEQSLNEYVSAWMLLHILKEEGVLGSTSAELCDTIFDLSVGYDLKGIQSDKVRGFMSGLMNARATIDRLRPAIPECYRQYRDYAFPAQISRSLTLSTFHGCPADEIERIVQFLLTEMDLHVIVKLNPTLLGPAGVGAILNDQLGYRDIEIVPDAFTNDLQWDDMVAMIARLRALAAQRGRTLGVKLSNTLVVKNKTNWFPASEALMYLSGPPLHVITTNLLGKIRATLGDAIPISFSAGVDKGNFTALASANITPITTCTDLLRTGGYARLSPYLGTCATKMKGLGVSRLSDLVVKAYGHGGAAVSRALSELSDAVQKKHGALAPELARFLADTAKQCELNLASQQVDLARTLESQGEILREDIGGRVDGSPAWNALVEGWRGLAARAVEIAGGLNTPDVVAQVNADPRYRAAANTAIPRKIGSKLWLYDCINCDKCIPVCPNDANFSYELAPRTVDAPVFKLTGNAVEPAGTRPFAVKKAHQIANFSDFCNECGNCDVFCPEDGGPYVEKARFFGSREAYANHRTHDGFLIERHEGTFVMIGRFKGVEHTLRWDRTAARALFTDGVLEVEVDTREHRPLATRALEPGPAGHTLSLEYYHSMQVILEGILDGKRVNYVNAHLR